MKVGVPRETAAGERRVALVPESAAKLVQAGNEGAVEAKVQNPSAAEAARLQSGSVLIGFLQPLTDREGIDRLGTQGVIAFAMESIPRITRAQSIDALSSQATVAG